MESWVVFLPARLYCEKGSHYDPTTGLCLAVIDKVDPTIFCPDYSFYNSESDLCYVESEIRQSSIYGCNEAKRFYKSVDQKSCIRTTAWPPPKTYCADGFDLETYNFSKARTFCQRIDWILPRPEKHFVPRTGTKELGFTCPDGARMVRIGFRKAIRRLGSLDQEKLFSMDVDGSIEKKNKKVIVCEKKSVHEPEASVDCSQFNGAVFDARLRICRRTKVETVEPKCPSGFVLTKGPTGADCLGSSIPPKLLCDHLSSAEMLLELEDGGTMDAFWPIDPERGGEVMGNISRLYRRRCHIFEARMPVRDCELSEGDPVFNKEVAAWVCLIETAAGLGGNSLSRREKLQNKRLRQDLSLMEATEGFRIGDRQEELFRQWDFKMLPDTQQLLERPFLIPEPDPGHFDETGHVLEHDRIRYHDTSGYILSHKLYGDLD